MAALNDLGLADSDDPRLRLIIDMLTETVYQRARIDASLEAAHLSPGDYSAESARSTWAAAVPDAARKRKITALIDAVVAEQPAFRLELERRLGALPAPPSGADLRGLTGEQIRLLHETAKATVELAGALAALARVSPMSGDFANKSARLQRSLSRAKRQLEWRVSVRALPDKSWAMDFIAAQAEALWEVRAAEERRCRKTSSGRSLTGERYVRLDNSITKLQRLLKERYPSLFTLRP
jgi:hypothetical protein